MSQSGYTPILIYASGTATNVPLAANLTSGSSGAELALNYADGKLFYKDSGGVVQVLATKGTGPIGGSNTQVQYNSSGSLAGSANLTFDGTTLTAAGLSGPHNGTVGATTPNTGAFTTLTTSSTVTINGGTANGVAYLNGSKVLTTGSALTFDGTNLGVGTSSPSEHLQVYGAGNQRLLLQSTAASGVAVSTQYKTASRTWEIGQAPGIGDNSFTIYDATAAAVRALFDTSGNLGLGVTPSAWGASYKALQVGGSGISAWTTSAAGGNLYLSNNTYFDGTNRKYIANAVATEYEAGSVGHVWKIAASGTAGTAITFTQAMTLDASGRLGIGITNPNYKIVASNAGAEGVEINPTGGINSGAFVQAYNRSGAAFVDLTYYAAAHHWTVGANEKMTLDTSGNLLVGTTSASFNSSNSTFFYPTTGYWVVNHANGTSTGTRYIGFGYNTGEIGSITQSGTTGVLYNITSDYRLKEFVAPVTNAGERIDALNPVEFDWKSDGSRARGFFAHEFQQVYANSVTGEKDGVDADGNPVYQTMQASTAEVIADLVAEIKSLRQRVAQLEVK